MMIFGVEVTNLWGVSLWITVCFALIVALVVILVREGKEKRRNRNMKYQNVNLSNPNELSTISVGDKIRINDWRTGLTVAHRTENHILLKGNEFGKEIISVVELLPSKYTHNNREVGCFTAGGDFWLFGWNGWYVGEALEVVMNESTMEAYLRSFEAGTTEFSRHAVAVKSMHVMNRAAQEGAHRK